MAITAQIFPPISASQSFAANAKGDANTSATVELFLDNTAAKFSLYPNEPPGLSRVINLDANTTKVLRVQKWTGSAGQNLELRLTGISGDVGSDSTTVA